VVVTAFPYGTAVSLLRRQDDGTYAAPEVFAHCAVEPRREAETPVRVWPPLLDGMTVYDLSSALVAASRDQMVVRDVTYEVDGNTEKWDSPYTGSAFGTVTYLRRTDNWFDTTVVVRTYLGATGLGQSWADPVEWPANLVAVSEMNSSGTGDELRAQVMVRVPPAFDGTSAVEAFAPGSTMTVSGRTVYVTSVEPFTRDGFAEYVQVRAQ
jgi:hypothetical protein